MKKETSEACVRLCVCTVKTEETPEWLVSPAGRSRINTLGSVGVALGRAGDRRTRKSVLVIHSIQRLGRRSRF